MIDNIEVKHFQSLVDTSVALGRVTVILGPNDHGKSALLRALRSAAEAASGVDFITYGHKQCRVTLSGTDDFGNGDPVDWSVSWIKGEKVNKYETTTGGFPQVFERVGREVPEDVRATLGLAPIAFDKDLTLNINFADQDDPPFLIPMPGGLSASGVAKILGDLTNLNLLFKALNEADRRRRAAQSLARVRRSDATDLDSQLSTFGDLDSELALQGTLESQLQTASAARTTLLELEGYRDRRNRLASAHGLLRQSRAQVGTIPKDELASTRSAFEVLHGLSVAQTKLGQLLQNLADSGVACRDARAQLKDAQTALDAVRAETPVEEERCPTCGQLLPH